MKKNISEQKLCKKKLLKKILDKNAFIEHLTLGVAMSEKKMHFLETSVNMIIRLCDGIFSLVNFGRGKKPSHLTKKNRYQNLH